jgi:hypothetical protein
MSMYSLQGQVQWDDFSWRQIENEPFAKLVVRMGVEDFDAYPYLDENFIPETPKWLVRLGLEQDLGTGTWSAGYYVDGAELNVEGSEYDDLSSWGNQLIKLLPEDYLEKISVGKHDCSGPRYLYQQWSSDSSGVRILVDSTLGADEVSELSEADYDALYPFNPNSEHVSDSEYSDYEYVSSTARIRMWIGCGECDPSEDRELVLDFDWSYNGKNAELKLPDLMSALPAIAKQSWSDESKVRISSAFTVVWSELINEDEAKSSIDPIFALINEFQDKDLATLIMNVISPQQDN